MAFADKTIIRLCEHTRTHAHLTPDQRARIADAAESWRAANNLNEPPLAFGGHDGRQIVTRAYVGVIEIADVVIEIYPKLDHDLLDRDAPADARVPSVLHNLLWMLETASYFDLVETDYGGLENAPCSFFDLFAWLFARRLIPELERGVAHAYQPLEDDLRAVRGRIRLADQITRNLNRYDRIACAWDEFTADTALNRLLKCACRFLHERVAHAETGRLLSAGIDMLAEAGDVGVGEALRGTQHIRWNRAIERFRPCYELGRRLLEGSAHHLHAGDTDTFVFLIDMNRLFERYVYAVLQARFNTHITEQSCLGTLFPQLARGGIRQKPDYHWRDDDGSIWIGDAKYKHLAEGLDRSLRFDDLAGNDPGSATSGSPILPDDVRQLTVYAELAKKCNPPTSAVNLMLLYPFVGGGTFEAACTEAWNGSPFWLTPVRVIRAHGQTAAAMLPAFCFDAMPSPGLHRVH